MDFRLVLFKLIVCYNDFNAKCFDISFPTSKSYFSSDSHVVFVCSKCHNSSKKPNATTTSLIKRKSLEITNSKSTSAHQSSSNQTITYASKLDKVMEKAEDQTQLLNQIWSRINQPQQQQQLSGDNACNCNNKINDAIKHLVDTVNSFSIKMSDSISSNSEKMLDSIANLKLISDINDSKRLSIDNINSSIINKINNWDMSMSTSSVKPDMRMNNSLSDTPNKNKHEEVFELYRRFEKLNWESIDIMNKKIDNLSSHMDASSLDSMNEVKESISYIKQKFQKIPDVEFISVKLDEINSNIDMFRNNINTIKNGVDQIHESENACDSFTENAVLDIMDKIETVKDNSNGNVNSNVTKSNEFYLTKFPPNTTAKCITDYMKNRGVTCFKSTHVIRLIPRNLDISTLSYVTFKIITDDKNSELIQRSDFWPGACEISRFVHRNPIAMGLNESIIGRDNHQTCDFL